MPGFYVEHISKDNTVKNEISKPVLPNKVIYVAQNNTGNIMQDNTITKQDIPYINNMVQITKVNYTNKYITKVRKSDIQQPIEVKQKSDTPTIVSNTRDDDKTDRGNVGLRILGWIVLGIGVILIFISLVGGLLVALGGCLFIWAGRKKKHHA